MQKLKKILINIHLGTLIILLTNFVFNTICDIGLISNLRFVLKILFYVSACLLFFYYIKPFKKKVIYFSLYIISPIFIFVSWLIDGIMGAILSSFFLFFFLPNDIRFENDQIQIKTKFEGLLGMCCKYEVIEKKFFLFETKIGEFQNEESLYFKQNNDIEIQKNKLIIHLKLKDYDVKEDHYILKNSTLEIPLRN